VPSQPSARIVPDEDAGIGLQINLKRTLAYGSRFSQSSSSTSLRIDLGGIGFTRTLVVTVDGQHKTVSPAEFSDLIHYLQSL
jgi:hypothetical protein